MRLTIVGCSGSLPGPDSPASCYLVRARHGDRDWNLLLDLGSGALGALQRHLSFGQIDAIALSHLHPDHCLDLCGLYVAKRYGRLDPASHWRSAPIPVYGPAGTAERILAAYGDGVADRMSGQFAFTTLTDAVPVALGPFRLTAYRVDHPVEAYGLRVEADGAVLAYTGDTDSCAALTPLAREATLLLAESGFVDGVDTVRGLHLSGRRAAEAAVAAGGVGRLMLTHIPPWSDAAVCRAQAAAVWPGEVELAVPDTTYEL